MLSIIKHTGSNTTNQNCKEQKSENSRQKARDTTYQLHANAPGRIHAHREQRIGPKKLVSSADNLLGPTVFIKQRHFKRTAGCGPVQSSGLYNRSRKAQTEGPKDTDQEREVSEIVFTELDLYTEETRLDEETAPVFKLADLA